MKVFTGFVFLIISSLCLAAGIPHVENAEDVAALFFKSPEAVLQAQIETIEIFKNDIQQIERIAPDQRTFDNTVQELDAAFGKIYYLFSLSNAIALTTPDTALREATETTMSALHQLISDTLQKNDRLYAACLAVTAQEGLSKEQKYFLDELLLDFKKVGQGLGEADKKEAGDLQNEIFSRYMEFQKNVQNDKSRLVASSKELKGLKPSFLTPLEKDENGNYLLGCDYPTYFYVMENCPVEKLRRRFYMLFNNRAYPANDKLLKNLLQLRGRLAQIMGYKNYAEFDLCDQMAKTPDCVISFLNKLQSEYLSAGKESIAKLKALPEAKNDQKKLRIWNSAYLSNCYKKKYLNIDEQELQQYFPLDEVLSGSLDIFGKFFDLKITVEKINLWSCDMKVLRMEQTDGGRLLGYLILDLYPRENKFSHACFESIIPAALDYTQVGIMVANLPKPQAGSPALLRHDDVVTFFHELGHALHDCLGRTAFYTNSGSRVKTDFVEMPSQLLEEWAWNKAILQKIGVHYQTGAPLPDELIDRLIAGRTCMEGLFKERQCALSRISLDLHIDGGRKNPNAIQNKLFKEFFPDVYFPRVHFLSSFIHLTEYGAKYYSYLWSKELVKQVFALIEKEGIENPRIGKRYESCILSKGGSVDPAELVSDFLNQK